jgi:hypothetical protein
MTRSTEKVHAKAEEYLHLARIYSDIGATRLKGVNNRARGNALGIRVARAQALKGRHSRSRSMRAARDMVRNWARRQGTSHPFRAHENGATVSPGRCPGLYYCRLSGDVFLRQADPRRQNEKALTL